MELSGIKYLEFGKGMAKFEPLAPPTNGRLALLPKLGLWALGSVLFVGGIIACKLGINDHNLEILLLLGFLGAMLGALVLLFTKEWTAVRIRSIISLLPGSLWCVMRDKAEVIVKLSEDADAFDRKLMVFVAAQSLGRSGDPSLAQRFEQERSVLEGRVRELIDALTQAAEIDERRYGFLITMKRMYFTPGLKIETEIEQDTIAMTRVHLLTACTTFGLKADKLMRYVPYLRSKA